MASVNVGYIGLGNIGKPCARRLLEGGFRVHVFDVNKQAVQELESLGAEAADSAGDLAHRCSHLGICVRDDEQVAGLLYGEQGIFERAQADTVVAVHSTVTQANLIQWSEDAAARGIHLIDAPITGGAHKAAEGALCYMVGGEETLLERCRPVFATSADKIVHAGELGAGIALKLCNNFIQYTEFVAMAEASRMAEACGLPLDVLREVGLSNGVVNEQMHMFVSGRNNLARNCSEEQMQEIFGALGELGYKDLQCALDTAEAHSVQMPTAEFVRDRIVDVFLARDPSRPPHTEGN